MPQFQIAVAERWSMKVWYEIDAPSAAEAVQRVKDCDAEPTTHEFLLNEHDDVEEILEASSDGEPLDVAPYNDRAAKPGAKTVRAALAESECPLESLDDQELFDIVSQIQKILWYNDREERYPPAKRAITIMVVKPEKRNLNRSRIWLSLRRLTSFLDHPFQIPRIVPRQTVRANYSSAFPLLAAGAAARVTLLEPPFMTISPIGKEPQPLPPLRSSTKAPSQASRTGQPCLRVRLAPPLGIAFEQSKGRRRQVQPGCLQST
jgi:hypothetical protein